MVWSILVFLALLVAVVVGVFLFGVAIYNGLVGLRNRVKNGWSQIDVQLKRRHDLIPNLVETAKGYMQHERETFIRVTEARAKAMGAGAGSPREVGQAKSGLSDALAKFLLTVESYPELKANENFLRLQEELTSTENRIAYARQAYNDDVLMLNNKIEMFPSNIVAGMFQFHKAEFFQIEDVTERKAPQVKF